MRYYAKHGWRDLGPRPDRLHVHAMELELDLHLTTRVTDAAFRSCLPSAAARLSRASVRPRLYARDIILDRLAAFAA
jgi:hypothetical protein